MNIEQHPSSIITYSFDVPIKQSPDKMWHILLQEIDAWWMMDFRVLGEGSTVSLAREAGGQLVETNPNGDCLQWYRVQMISQYKLYLVGDIAPEWGGPAVSMLKLELKPDGDDSVLIVSDALMGKVSESSAKNLCDGWQLLFGTGLKQYAEKT